MAANLSFCGEETFSAPPERLFAALTDLPQLAKALPDVVSSEEVDERTLNCVVRPGFSFLRGTLKLHIVIADRHASESATMTVDADGIGAHIKIESRLQIAAFDGGSRLAWTANVVELKGLVATVSRPLISAAAERTIRKAWERVHASLEGA